MQVSVETTKGLGRKMTVSLPSEQFQAAYDQRLKSLAKTSKVPGVRPGKVPLSVIKQKYGANVKQEILADLIKHSYGQALGQQKLNPAGLPHIDSKPPVDGEDVKYTAEFEVYPEVKLVDLAKLKISRPVVEITAADVDAALEKLRKQRGEWLPVERAARDGDQIKIDFAGSIDGQPFEGGTADDVALVLGGGQMIDGFESQLLGIAGGEQRDISVTFPKDYGQPSLQGKKALFAVHCKAVMEQKLPELDDAFAKSFGAELGSVDALRQQIEDHLKRERDQNVRNHTKEQVMQGLVDLHKLELPNVLVDAEIVQLQKQFARQVGLKEGDIGRLPRDGFEERARLRVHLGLVLAQLSEENSIKGDEHTVRELIAQSVVGYENAPQMFEAYLNDKRALQYFQSLAVEEKLVDLALERAKITDKTLSFDELLKLGQAG